MVKLLLAAGANIHADYDGALRLASMDGHLEVVNLLLEYGADVHANDGVELRLASQRGHLEVVKVLLEARLMTESGVMQQWREKLARQPIHDWNWVAKHWMRLIKH